MAMIYVPDGTISEVLLVAGKNKQQFVKEAIEEKLEREIDK